MTKYLLPLKVFVGGQFLLLFVYLFLPALGGVGDQLAADTANWSSIGWGWTWVVSSVRLIVVVLFQLLILFATAKAFLSVKG